jgi:hypothetical protein
MDFPLATMNRYGFLLHITFAVIFTSCHVLAAEITVQASDSGTAFILIAGPIEAGDAEKFSRSTGNVQSAIIVFSSPGGLLMEGLSIGADIKDRGYITAVAEDTLCASACALAWLGGARRLMTNTSKIGFHAAFVSIGQYKRESGVGNAIVGAYLNQLGLSLDAVRYITTPGPDEIQWLSVRDALRIGISVYSIEDTTLGSTASGVAKSFASGGYASAQRAVENLYKQMRSQGIIGLAKAVQACYARAADLRTIASVQYCFTFDLISSDLSAWGAKTYGFPVTPYFTPSQVNNRVQLILDSLGYSGDGALLTEWQNLALIANLESAAKDKERASIAPPTP